MGTDCYRKIKKRQGGVMMRDVKLSCGYAVIGHNTHAHVYTSFTGADYVLPGV